MIKPVFDFDPLWKKLEKFSKETGVKKDGRAESNSIDLCPFSSSTSLLFTWTHLTVTRKKWRGWNASADVEMHDDHVCACWEDAWSAAYTPARDRATQSSWLHGVETDPLPVHWQPSTPTSHPPVFVSRQE